MFCQITAGRFVGRAQELARLRDLLARAAMGEPLVALVGGEAGVGKTRLADQLAGWAEYGYCASHSRYLSGLRLHLIATLGGLPIGFALAGAKADKRQVLLGILEHDPGLAADRPGQLLIGDKNYYGKDFEAGLAGKG
jgi:AAA ATPase domain